MHDDQRMCRLAGDDVGDLGVGHARHVVDEAGAGVQRVGAGDGGAEGVDRHRRVAEAAERLDEGEPAPAGPFADRNLAGCGPHPPTSTMSAPPRPRRAGPDRGAQPVVRPRSTRSPRAVDDGHDERAPSSKVRERSVPGAWAHRRVPTAAPRGRHEPGRPDRRARRLLPRGARPRPRPRRRFGTCCPAPPTSRGSISRWHFPATTPPRSTCTWRPSRRRTRTFWRSRARGGQPARRRAEVRREGTPAPTQAPPAATDGRSRSCRCQALVAAGAPPAAELAGDAPRGRHAVTPGAAARRPRAVHPPAGASGADEDAAALRAEAALGDLRAQGGRESGRSS